MSFAQLKDQLETLEPAERRKAITFLVARENDDDQEFKRMLAEEMDNRDPANWVPWKAVRDEFADE